MYTTQKNSAGIAMLVAITVVLQLLSSFLFPVLQFSLSLVMIPIVIAAVYFGKKGGMIVGTSFGITVLIQCILGLDKSGSILFNINPYFTFLATVFRGLLVGLIAACVFTLFMKLTRHFIAATAVTAAVAVISNTGIFLLLFTTLFNETLYTWAGNETALHFIVFSLVGLNFIIEFSSAVLLTPPVAKALSYVKKQK
ncbi:MAG TPA: hypothetical protein DCY74_01470 [Clostridiales bacterium]|jgi:uncharacterized membrane protein|nr:hypothetical protein [Clostridiales bacterium]